MMLDPTCDAPKPMGYSLPSLHWWLSLTASDQGAWVAGIGALLAAGVALWFGFSQQWKDRRASLAIRVAVADTLTTDLQTVGEYFRNNIARWSDTKKNAESARQSISQLAGLKLPSFESFHELLPKMGSNIAPAVIESYGYILRMTALAAGHHASERKIADDFHFLGELVKGLPNVLTSIARAEEALRPYVSKR